MGKNQPQVSEQDNRDLEKLIFQPLETYRIGRNEITAGTVSPSYLLPLHGLQRLEVFQAVAKHLSFTKAVETLLDDAESIQFGFRFLRQVLFGEMCVPIFAENTAQRRARVTGQRARIEREAARADSLRI